ncbi:hypothetical protein [Halorussus halophilus]|uniref:hypothetical protein n=1 Tax=Halorussus halophilus TaxID=2650975 RepID=UPI00178858B6|nr:hypothetical protein [Halorussus halophilus]
METSEKRLLTGGVALVGAGCFLALSVYPFQYGTVESAVLAGALVVVGLFEFALDETSF